MSNKVIIIIGSVIIYAATTFGSFAFFYQNPNAVTLPGTQKIIQQSLPPTTDKNGSVVFNQTLPRTDACPLNGAMYSSQQQGWWVHHRPLGVMIENHSEARPQSGLSYADVVYEAVAEGGITRFLSIFYCQDAPQIGPIRSARTYFLDYLSEYGEYPLYAHVGGANADGVADALSQLDSYGWSGYNDLNQFSIGFPVFWRDYDRLGHSVATEHTMYSTTSKLWDYATKSRGLTNLDKQGVSWDKNFVPYTFKEDAPESDRPANQKISLQFWTTDPDYYVTWTYDKKTNTYARQNGNSNHLDRDTNKQLTAKTLVLMLEKESHANDGYENNVHLVYADKGAGKAIVFQDGKQTLASWRKDSRTARTIITQRSSAQQIEFNRGLLWFSILPLDGVIEVK